MTYTFEDDRFAYGEQRFVTLGLLVGITVSVVHTENEHEIRIISLRKATKHELHIYFDAIQVCQSRINTALRAFRDASV